MEREIGWALILLVLLALLLYAISGIGARPSPLTPIDYSASILVSPNPSFFGTPLNVTVRMSSCQLNDANLTLDGLAINSTDDGQELLAQIEPDVGMHNLAVVSGQCSGSLEFTTLEPACAQGRQKSCEISPGCSGEQTCDGGIWGDCQAPARICNPGQKVSCPITSCAFGVSYCDACGNGWGECAVPQQ